MILAENIRRQIRRMNLGKKGSKKVEVQIDIT
jgi:hypothetical protein